MGQHMRHDVVAGGPCAQACTDLLAEGCVISWRDRGWTQVPGKGKMEGKAGVRTPYTCRRHQRATNNARYLAIQHEGL